MYACSFESVQQLNSLSSKGNSDPFCLNRHKISDVISPLPQNYHLYICMYIHILHDVDVAVGSKI